MAADDLLCSRSARSRTPALGLMARLGVPVGGRVRKLRAVEDQSAPTPDRTGKLGESLIGTGSSMRAGKPSWPLPTKRKVY